MYCIPACTHISLKIHLFALFGAFSEGVLLYLSTFGLPPILASIYNNMYDDKDHETFIINGSRE